MRCAREEHLGPQIGDGKKQNQEGQLAFANRPSHASEYASEAPVLTGFETSGVLAGEAGPAFIGGDLADLPTRLALVDPTPQNPE